MILDFPKEKAAFIPVPRHQCPACQTKGEYCPDWVHEVCPGDGEFEKFSINKTIEWLKHVMHSTSRFG